MSYTHSPRRLSAFRLLLSALLPILFSLRVFQASAALPEPRREYLRCRGSESANIFSKIAGARCRSGAHTFDLQISGFGTAGGLAYRTGYVVVHVPEGRSLDDIVGVYRGMEFGLSAGFGIHVGVFSREGDRVPLYAFGLVFGAIGDLSDTTITISRVETRN